MIRFGEFVLDLGSRELLRSGKPVALSPKAFRLLQALAEGRPKALSKADLHDLLWPETAVVEANLSNLVGEVRAALGEDSRRPRFIRTLHRFGYAFSPDAGPPAAPSSASLRLRWPGGNVVLGDGEHVIGRDAELAACLASASVSRRHALLRLARGEATLEDLGSKHGTWLNGRRLLAAEALRDGDEILAGSVRLRVSLLPLAGSTATSVSRSRDR
jgi:DNA-binding winged helix-turn-helix (wHTH) protein